MIELDPKALEAAFFANHDPRAEPSTVELGKLSKAIRAYLAALSPPATSLEDDKRAIKWRVRLQLFSSDGALEADTDPELLADKPGTETVHGLPGMAEWAAEMVHSFHTGRSEATEWLSNDETKRRLKSLRPTLSRNNGSATWRVDYKVNGAPWRAHVDVRREVESDAT